MSTTQGIRMKTPARPGGFVKSEIIEAYDLSVTDAAKALGVTRPALSAFLNERAALSPEMALRIEKAFGISMDTLMRMQNSYDIAQARADLVSREQTAHRRKPPLHGDWQRVFRSSPDGRRSTEASGRSPAAEPDRPA